MTKRLILIFGLVLLLALPLAGQATVNKAQENVYLPADQVHQGNYYAAGNAVEIAGTVNGDVFAAGNSVSVSGTVNGDVFAAGSSIRISGKVDGNVRLAGSNIVIDGQVTRNVMAAGSNLVVSETAEVGRHLAMAGAVVDVRSRVGGNLEFAGNTLTMASEVGGNAYLRPEEASNIRFLPNAHIKGDFVYTARQQITMPAAGQIDGQIIFNPVTSQPRRGAILGIIAVGYLLAKLIQLFGLLIVALVIISLARKKVLEITDLMIKKPASQIGQGIIWFFITPIICLLLLVTLIGIPLGLIGGAFYLILLYLGQVFASIALGLILTRALGWQKASLMVSMIIGVVMFVILRGLPVIGWLVCLVGIWWGLGALIEIKKKAWQEMR